MHLSRALPRQDHPRSLRFARPELITLEEAERVHALAKRILADIGMEIRHAGALEALRADGHRVVGERVYFDGEAVDECVEEVHRLAAPLRDEAPGGMSPDGDTANDDVRLHLSVSSYSLFVHDLDLDRVVQYTEEHLIEMTKLLDSLADEGVSGTPPGIPIEVHPDLHPIAQYRIAALYARQGATPVDPTSARTVNYLLDMADVMGQPIRRLPVYVPSPLRLGGESLDVVLACVNRLDHVSVSSMPSTGATAPIRPFGALALASAEVIGGAIAVRLLTGKPVSFGAQIFPFDLRAGAMVFGSPENLLMQMLCSDYNRVYGWPGRDGPGNIHVMSKMPDAQSAADKAAIMSIGAFLGARRFGSAGTLSLDEVFSAEQLLLDCEIRDWVQRAIMGVDIDLASTEEWLDEVRKGVKRGFMGLDSTLDDYTMAKLGPMTGRTWYPGRFERAAIGPWLKAGQPSLSRRLQDEARRRITRHSFELERDRALQIERIFEAAQSVVGE